MIKFAHISPTPFLDKLTSSNGAHLILAHLVESDEVYREYYANINDGKPKILDNSMFEMYKRNLPPFDPNKLVSMGKAVKADYIVMSDYPNEPGYKTIATANTLIPIFKENGFKTFFVPQSIIGDINDYMTTFEWACKNKDIDLIGVSILGVPNAFGVERGNKLQRYMSRFHMMTIFKENGILDRMPEKKLHFLGMVDGPNEILLNKQFEKYIYSWDSSAAVWAGLNNIGFDNSPTGMVNGKFELEVDFDHSDDKNIDVAIQNIEYINSLL